MAKKYYWLKLGKEFFSGKAIKKLRKIAGGDTYTIIYLKMLLITTDTDGLIEFEGYEETLAEELALELDEEVDNVRMTIAFLEKVNLIELVEEDKFLLPESCKMTGSESKSAERVRKHRERKKQLDLQVEKQKTLQCNTYVTNSNEHKELELEKEIELKKELELLKTNENSIYQVVEYAYGRPITPIEVERLDHMVKENNFELVKYAIELGSSKGIRSLDYADKVLTDWQDKGIINLNQAEGYVNNFNKSKEKPKKQYKPKETTGDKKLEEFEKQNKRKVRVIG